MTGEEAMKELSYIAEEMPSMECADWKEAIGMAIKALEQESVLGKIRAEIEQIELLAGYTRGDIKQKVLDIIDKYREGSEGE